MSYPIHGKVCEITVDGATANQVANMTDFEINVTLDTDEKTAFQDDWKTRVVGAADWSGTMNGLFNPSDTYQKELMDLIVAATPTGILADGRFQLEDSGDYWSGSLIINTLNNPVSIAGVVKITFGFIGNGELSLTIA